MYIDILLLDTFLGLPCWLLWGLASLLSFLLGLILGYWLWAKYLARVKVLEGEVADWHKKYNDMEQQYFDMKYKHDELEKTNNQLRTSLQRCEADKAVLKVKLDKALSTDADAGGQDMIAGAVAAGAVAGSRGLDDEAETDYLAIFGADNLQVVEGVGPKIETLLKNAGIATWAALGAANADDLKKILEDAGPSYRIHDPKSWPQQARLAAEGKWDELIELQKFLDTGRGDKGDFATPAKVEKLMAKIMGFSTNPEDLKIIEGIGPKIEGLLKEAGINTWSDLANAETSRLEEILAAAGERYRLANPGTWPKQAELAAAGKWDELKKYQDFLSGGRDKGAE